MDSEWMQAEREYTDEVIGDDTLPRMYFDSVERNAGRVAQQYKGGAYDRSLRRAGVVPAVTPGQYGSLTYEEMGEIVRNLASGFVSLGVEPGDRVAIFANTRMEWAQSDLALLTAGGVVTTIYTESSPKQARYLMNDPGATGVVVENQALLERVLAVEDDLDLEFIVVMDELGGDDAGDAGDDEVVADGLAAYEERDDIVTLGELHAKGAATRDDDVLEERMDSRDLDDLASLIYTSGTTGKPKGVQLTHGNFRANVNQVRRRFADRPGKPDDAPSLTEETRAVSFLPLAHVYERTSGHFVMFASGATVAYAESPDTLADDMGVIHPNSATSVPRVYERIFRTMRQEAGDGVKKRIFEAAIDTAREWARTDDPGLGLRVRYAVADRLVYSQLADRLGGEVEFFISGGGSLSKELAELFEGMGLPILEGYGLTECSPVVSTNRPEDIRPGTLGPLVSEMEGKLDESKATPTQIEQADGEIGELLLKGPNVFDGYWKRSRETSEAFTEDGYFRTGDLIERTDDGYLVFHDRVKQLMKLTTGKYVAPAPIEDAFATSDRVEQVMVVGDDQKMVGALIVPDFETLQTWADDNDVDLPDDHDAICEDDRVHAWIEEEVDRINEDFEEHETVKQFELVAEEWTPENDLLTASMKIKRRNVEQRYADKLDRIYAE